MSLLFLLKVLTEKVLESCLKVLQYYSLLGLREVMMFSLVYFFKNKILPQWEELTAGTKNF